MQQSTKSAALSPLIGQKGDGFFSLTPASGPAPGAVPTTSAPVRAFDYLVDNELKAFGDIGKEIGGVVAEQVVFLQAMKSG